MPSSEIEAVCVFDRYTMFRKRVCEYAKRVDLMDAGAVIVMITRLMPASQAVPT